MNWARTAWRDAAEPHAKWYSAALFIHPDRRNYGWRTHPLRREPWFRRHGCSGVRWGAVTAEKAAEEQQKRNGQGDRSAAPAPESQEFKGQDEQEEQHQTALQHAHRAGLGFAGALVEKLMAQGQGQEEAEEQSRQGQADDLRRTLRTYGESTSHEWR